MASSTSTAAVNVSIDGSLPSAIETDVANVEATDRKKRSKERAQDLKKKKKRIANFKRVRSIMKEPEVKRMSDWIKYMNSPEQMDGLQPKRSIPCFPSVKPGFHVEEKRYDPDCSLRHDHFGWFRREQMLNELIIKRLKEKESLRKLKKRVKEYKRRDMMEDKETEDVTLAETQPKDNVGGLEDDHGNREVLMLDVSASSQVDEDGHQLRRRTSPYEQTGNLKVEGLKSCTTEAGKKTASHSEGI